MSPPPCRSLGRHCHALDVTLRVAALEGSQDHDATWLLGHTQRVDFGELSTDDDELWVEARIHVPCRHLQLNDDSTVSCKAHGFTGVLPAPQRKQQPRRLGGDNFNVVERERLVSRRLPMPRPARNDLPVVESPNPCVGAPCRTADNRQGAACCRDLHVDIACHEDRETLEALLRNRKVPYLCKVDREDEEILSVEILSACDYLQDDGISCDLHGRLRSDGRPAKPELCSKWPEKRTGLHPGCVFANPKVPL